MKRYKTTGLLFVLLLSAALYGQTGTDSLACYLKTAAENNPSVQAAFHTYEAALQKVPQMGAYEDPRLDMGFFLEPMTLVEGRQVAQFQLMQMFPWFGVKKAAQTEAQHMAKMAFEEFRETRNSLFLDVYTQWYNLCALQQRLVNNEENAKLLQHLEELAVGRYATARVESIKGAKTRTDENAKGNSANSTSGMNMGSSGNTGVMSGGTGGGMNGEMGGGMSASSSGMSEALRIQLERLETENNIESVLSEIVAAKARFNALLNRPPENAVSLPDSFPLIPFLMNVESVMQQISEQNPMLGMIREEIQAYGARLEMEKKMGYPMFGIGLQYMLINAPISQKATSMDDNSQTPHNDGGMKESMKGRDMLMPMISVTIPLYRNKYGAAQRESRLRRQASEEKYVNARNDLQAELFWYKHQLDDNTRKITLYKKQINLARTTYDLMIREFISGKNELGEVIQVQRQLLDYELKIAEAVASHNIMAASIQKLISSFEK